MLDTKQRYTLQIIVIEKQKQGVDVQRLYGSGMS